MITVYRFTLPKIYRIGNVLYKEGEQTDKSILIKQFTKKLKRNYQLVEDDENIYDTSIGIVELHYYNPIL
jgi:hypothetical protein